ncbi:MAG: hypothetical protein WD512_10450, partial [Candidatus Paceibacterota bacterium]
MDSLPFLVFNKIICYYQGSIKQVLEIARLLGHEKRIDPSYSDYMNKIGKMIDLYKLSHNYDTTHRNPNVPNLPIISNRDDYLNSHSISNNQLSEIKSLTNYLNVVNTGLTLTRFEWGYGLDLIEGIWIDCGGDYFSGDCLIELYLSSSDKPKSRHRNIPLLFHSRKNKLSSEFQLFHNTIPFIMKPRHHHFIEIRIDNRSGHNINNIRIRIDYRSILNNQNMYQLTYNLHTLWHQSLQLRCHIDSYNILFPGANDFSLELSTRTISNGGFYGFLIYSPVPLISKINLSLGQTIDTISFDSSFINTLAQLYNIPQLPYMFCYPIIFSDNTYKNMCKYGSDFSIASFKNVKVYGSFSQPPNRPILFNEFFLHYDT